MPPKHEQGKRQRFGMNRRSNGDETPVGRVNQQVTGASVIYLLLVTGAAYMGIAVPRLGEGGSSSETFRFLVLAGWAAAVAAIILSVRLAAGRWVPSAVVYSIHLLLWLAALKASSTATIRVSSWVVVATIFIECVGIYAIVAKHEHAGA